MISDVWPKAKIDGLLKRNVSENPNQEFEFVEGTYYNPAMPVGKQYCYFVVERSQKALILEEKRSLQPVGGVPPETYRRRIARTRCVIGQPAFAQDSK